MDKISYALAAQADAKATEALALAKSLIASLNSANQTIQSLTTELNDLKTKYDSVKTQLDNTTPFDANVLNDYSKKVQNINTDTVFIDSNTGAHFKMYITNNVIAIEEIAPIN
jgi:chromosome segregation ATPase